MRLGFVSVFCLLLFLLYGSAGAQAGLPTLDDLKPEQWNRIAPGGDTICANGTPFAFFVRPGTSAKLLIHFEGGGACWNALTCGALNPDVTTFDQTVADDELAASASTEGIFNFDRADNPFKDYSLVFVSYCTADVHVGDSVVTYSTGKNTVAIQHKGYVNATTALDWTYTNFQNPETVFVTGCSAGSLGSAFYAPDVMQHYPDAPVTQLGDSAGAYRGDLSEQFANWGTAALLPDLPGYASTTAANLSFEQMYIAGAQQYPQRLFAQYNSARDVVQSFFLNLMPDTLPIEDTLPANLNLIAASVPNFRYFTAGGTQHCLTPSPDFYTYKVNGVRLRDWVADLAAGKPVENIQCTDCETAER